MSTTSKSTLKKRLILVLLAALVITAIIPISSMGSEGPTATVQFNLDGAAYGDKISISVSGDESTGKGSDEDEERTVSEYYLDPEDFPDDPEKQGYKFVGWTDGTNLYTRDGNLKLKLTADTDFSLEAVFEEDPDSLDDEPVSDPKIKVKSSDSNNKLKEEKTAESFTVRFIVDSNVTDTKKVTSGSSVEMPVNPDVPQDMTAFKGWYTNIEGTGEAFDFATEKITKNMDIFAVFTSNYMVYFKDASGTIMESQEVVGGKKAAEPKIEPQSQEKGQLFQYWYIEGTDENSQFSFTAPVYSNLTLVPKFSSQHFVFFEEYSGKINSVSVDNGSAVDKPTDPEREGYKFKFWSTDKSAASTEKSTKEFDFSTEINESFTLYAIWEGQKVGYSVVFWVENANIKDDPGTDQKNYTQSGTMDVKSADSSFIAGQTLSKDNTKGIADSHYTSMSSNNKALKYSDYSFSSLPTLKGDGTSVVNVYYKRMIFTCVLDLNKSGAYITMNDTKYTYKENDYSFTAKYEENISDKFPLDTAVTYPGETNVIDGWTCSADNITNRLETPHSTPTLFNEILIHKNYKTNGRTFTTTAVWKDKNSMAYMWRHIYVSLTDYEKSRLTQEEITKIPETSTLNGSSFPTSGAEPPEYVKYTDTTTTYGRQIDTVTIFKRQSQLTMEGYATKSNGSASYDHQSIGKITGTSAFDTGNMKGTGDWVTTKKDAADDEPNYLTQNINNSQRICWYLYERNEVYINLNLQGGSLDDKTGTVKHDGILVNENAEYALEKIYDDKLPQPTKAGMEFDGWYFDSSYTIPLTKNTEVSYPGLELYAKYTKDPCNVTYFDKVDGRKITENVITSVEKGEILTAPDLYSEGITYDGLGKFVGWGWKPYENSDVIMIYDFDNLKITGDLTLYGVWDTGSFKITYDEGENEGIFSDITYAAPEDSNTYKLNVKAPVKNMISNFLEGLVSKVFVGWRIDGIGAIYYPGSTATITKDINFVAVYADKDTTTTITYNPNYTDASDSPITKGGIMIGQEGTLLGDDTFKRPGYKLIGWSTDSSDVTPEYDLGGMYTPQNIEGTTFYAVWKEVKTYTITFMIQKGQEDQGALTAVTNTNTENGIELTSEDDVKIVYTVNEDTLLSKIKWPNAESAEDYLFVGWNKTTEEIGLKAESNIVITGSFEKHAVIDLSSDITLKDSEKFYGENDPSDFEYTLSGKLEKYKDDFNIEVTRTKGEDADSYDINATVIPKSGAESDYVLNNDISPAIFTIKPIAITITANSYPEGTDVLYPTSTLPALEASFDKALVSGDAIDYDLVIKDYSGTGTPPTGAYDIVINVKGEYSNYVITTVDGTLTITKAPVIDDPEDDTTGSGILDMATDPEQDESLASGTADYPANTNAGGTDGTVASQTAAQVAATQAVADGLVPAVNIGDTDVPLYSNGLFDSWALLNLIFTVLGGLAILVGIIKAPFGKNREEEYETAYDDEENKDSRKKTMLWLAAGLIFALAGIVLFVLTQDMTLPMVFIDKWTVVNAVLFILALLSSIFSSKMNKEDNMDGAVKL